MVSEISMMLKCALNVLCTSGSSVDAGKLFSSTRQVLSKLRSKWNIGKRYYANFFKLKCEIKSFKIKR